MKITNYLFLIIVLIIIFSGAGCISNENESDITTYCYNIVIISNNSNPYVLILPIPLIRAEISPNFGNETKIVSDLSILNGLGNFSLINCEYGKALEIRAIGNITISANKRVDHKDTESLIAYGFEEISLIPENNSNSYRYLYFNSSYDTGVILTFECKNVREYYRGGHQYIWGLDEKIILKGWHEYNMLIKQEVD